MLWDTSAHPVKNTSHADVYIPTKIVAVQRTGCFHITVLPKNPLLMDRFMRLLSLKNVFNPKGNT